MLEKLDRFCQRPDYAPNAQQWRQASESEGPTLYKCDWFSCWRLVEDNGVTYVVLPGASELKPMVNNEIGSPSYPQVKSCTGVALLGESAPKWLFCQEWLIPKVTPPLLTYAKTGGVTLTSPRPWVRQKPTPSLMLVERKFCHIRLFEPVSVQRFSPMVMGMTIVPWLRWLLTCSRVWEGISGSRESAAQVSSKRLWLEFCWSFSYFFQVASSIAWRKKSRIMRSFPLGELEEQLLEQLLRPGEMAERGQKADRCQSRRVDQIHFEAIQQGPFLSV